MQAEPALPSPVDTLRASLDTLTTRAHALIEAETWLALAATSVRVGTTLVVALVLLAVIGRVKRRWVERRLREPGLDKRRQRVLTVADLLATVATVAVWTVAAMTVLAQIGINIGPILASAGIVGLAVGFGAQTLVKDVISGVFLLADDTLGYGDLITFNGETATVEHIGLRIIKARKFDGELLIIPAGDIRTFGNKSVGFARVIVDVGLSYEQNVEEVLHALEDVAAEWAATPEAKAVLLDATPEVQGVMSLGESSVNARVVVRVRPGEQFAAERNLRRLIKERFDQRGVEIPFPRRTVYVKSLDDGSPDIQAAAGGAD